MPHHLLSLTSLLRCRLHHFFLYIIIIVSAGYSATAQTVIKGLVLAADNEAPVSYASIYVAETKSGVVADESGRFILRLHPGRYRLAIRSMGYTPLETELLVGEKSEEKTFRLSSVIYDLKEVEVIGKRPKEDPAYPIMRELIARTPVYEHMVKSYQAKVYTKGSMRLDKLPFWLRYKKADGISAKDLEKKRFVIESQASLEFRHPNKYNKQVRAMRSSIPDDLKSDTTDYMQIISTNIYAKEFSLDGIVNMTSPIRTGVLESYTYKLEGTSREKERKVYHISFKGRRDAMRGELWVIDSIWCLQALKLEIKAYDMIRYKVDISLNPLEKDVYLPTTYAIGMEMQSMGLKLEYQYFSSLVYDSLEIDRKLLSTARRAEGLRFRTNREVNRHLRMLESRLDTLGYHLPDKYMLPDTELQAKVRFDSLAFDRDSSYWDAVVTAPLTDEEAQSYANRDSLMQAFEKKRRFGGGREGERTGRTSILGAILGGHDYKMGEGTTLGFNGLIRGSLYDYRYTDGFWLGQSFFFRQKFSKGVDLTLRPILYYTTHRRKLYWDVRADFRYAPLSGGLLSLSAGRQSADLTGPFANTDWRIQTFLTTLVDGRGHLMLYDKKYLRLSNQIDLLPGLQLFLFAEGRHSSPLAENRVWGIFKKPIKNKLIGGIASSPDSLLYSMPDHRSLTVGVSIRYNPAPYYRLDKDGRKRYDGVGTRAPLFGLTYRQAIPLGREHDSDYIYLSGSVRQNLRLNPLHSLYYHFTVGSYFRRHTVHLDEQRYLKADNALFQIGGTLHDSFQTLPPYSYTDQNFLILQTRWSFPSLITNPLGILFASFQSNLHLNTYWGCHKDRMPFFEIGYSRGTIAQIGIFCGAYNFHKDYGLMLRYTINFPTL